MHVHNLLLVIISATLFSTLAAYQNDVVATHSGKIEGKRIFFNGITIKAYLGIPYAKPPVGKLRFKKPVPVDPWNTTLEAKTFPPGCIQYSRDPFPWADFPPGLSEDCLYLNVWTPMKVPAMKSKLSVMFWIHGGGLTLSSSRMDIHHGQALAAEGNVIVVTINFRIGAEGFLYSGTEDAPGNMGLWDMAEALKWVRNNIEFFGGDKDSITIFGHSSGGIVVGMLCVSPITKGLFKRAIMQSGSPTNLNGEDNDKALRTSQKLAKAVGCATDEYKLEEHPETVVECMRNKNASELAVLLSNVTLTGPKPVYPRHGDEFLPKNPRQAIIDGDFDPVDLLIGSSDGEGSPLLTISMRDVFGLFGEKNPRINLTFGAEIIRNKFKSYPDPDAVVKQYLDGLGENDYDRIRLEVFNSLGDYNRLCPSVYFAESFSKNNARVYYYFFTHMPSNTPWAPWMLSVHFYETPFVWGHPLRYPHNYTVAEQGFSRRIMWTWTNFAKTGHPGVGTWLQHSRESPAYTVLDVGYIAIGNGPHKENCDFFRHTFGF